MSPKGGAQTDAGRRDPMLGRIVLGRYRVIDVLAQGGMGVVYLGRTEGAAGFARAVVIKRVLPQLLGDPSIGKMFVREARILSHLRHPAVVGVIDFGEEDEAYIMVLEYVHGYDAAQWLSYLSRTKRRVHVDVALRIATQVLDALHYAHTLKRPDGTPMQVVHRDISPGNILLDTEGHVRLSDFGIARIANELAEYKTQETTFKGKIGYSHPSLLARGEPTPQSDVYSVAVVLFQLLTGVNPFRGKTAAETVSRVVSLPTPRLRDYWEDAPEELEQVVLKGMAREIEAGFPDAQAFAEALRKNMGRPESDVAVDLSELLTRDFCDLPAVLSRQTLEERDRAWRRSIPGARPGALMSTPPLAHDGDQPTLVEEPADEPTARDTASATKPTVLAGQSAAGGQRWIAASILVLAVALTGVALALFFEAKPSSTEPRYVVVSKDEPAPAASHSAELLPLPASSESSEPSGSAQGDEPPSKSGPAPSPSGVGARDPGVAQDAPATRRKPDPQYFTQTFTRRQASVQQCFDQANESDLALQIGFRVDAEGRVTEATLSPGALTGSPVGQCLLRIARGTSFGPLTEGASFRIPVEARKR